MSAGDSDRPDFGALASQLFPVARLFESLGFMSISREVAYVEKALVALDPQREAAPAPASSPGPVAQHREFHEAPGEALLERAPDALDDLALPAPRDRFAIPRPVGLMLLVLLFVILGSILTVRWHATRQRRFADEPALAAAQPTPTRPAPTVSPTPRTAATPTPTRAEELADQVGRARLALQEGDLDQAISLVSSAALIDAGSSSVIDTAQSIVNALLARSDAVANEGDWDHEQRLLDSARELSVRFGFPTAPVDSAAHRHAAIIRFEIILPNDLAAIAAARGKRVRVYLEGGSFEDGRIRGVNGPSLELDQTQKVGGGLRGGEVRYIEPIHLDLITEIRVYED